jgi:hypothetical protein
MIFYLILLLLIFVFFYFKPNRRITFLTKSQACKILKFKPYFNNFNQNDFKVRNCKDIQDCMNLYCNNIKSFTYNEKAIIINYVNKVRKHPFLKPYNWKFIRVKDIENSYPHTQKDCIVISDTFMEEIIHYNGSSTLIHEQIHVIQRLDSKKMNQHLKKELYFFPIKNLKGVEQYLSNSRSNPDEDLNNLWVYKNKMLPICLYKSNPHQLSDAGYYGLKVENNEIISELIPLHNFKDYEHLKLGKNYYNGYEVQAEFLEQKISKDIFG